MAPILIPIPEIMRFIIVLLRISGIMLLAPFFSGQTMPMQVRAAFALVVAFVLAPSLPLSSIPAQFGLGDIAGIAVGEILAGLLLGFAASCVFAGLQFAGQMIAFQLGFSLINQIDPQTNVEAPVFSFLHNYIGLLLFLLVNGHHWFLMAANESFKTLPVGGIHIQPAIASQLLYLSSEILVIGLRIAGPIIAATVITDVVLGIIGRAAPQIHIIVVGMPLKVLIGFGCLSFSFYFLPRYLENVFLTLHKTLLALVNAAI
jgi:flagellar biosynthetic protein FliR